jgi:hypothetical protein
MLWVPRKQARERSSSIYSLGGTWSNDLILFRDVGNNKTTLSHELVICFLSCGVWIHALTDEQDIGVTSVQGVN